MTKKLSPATFIGVQGDGIISFGSGQPDILPPKEIFEVLDNAKKDFRYGLIQGREDLRNAISKEYPGSNADNFVITNGASEALDLTMRVIGESGGKILLHKPYYYSYPPLVKFANLEMVCTETVQGKIDIDDFKKKIDGCKAVLINSPSNPTGRIQEIETLKEIERITQEKDIALISDEVYKDIIYERENYLLSGPHVVTINSFSKNYSMCGFRVGYLYSNDKSLIDKIIELKSHTSMNTDIIAQEMALASTNIPKKHLEERLKIWRERRDFICKGLENLGLDFWKPEGAFYVLPKIENSEKVVRDLFEKHKVITYLGEWFGAPGRIRMSYALDKDKIEEGLDRIGKYLKKIK